MGVASGEETRERTLRRPCLWTSPADKRELTCSEPGHALAPGPAPVYLRRMSVAAFDTHAAVTALREAGFDERQAEGVATKADVARLETRMRIGMLTAVGAVVALVKLLP